MTFCCMLILAWLILGVFTCRFLFPSLIDTVISFRFLSSVGQGTSQLAKEPCPLKDLCLLVRQKICKKLDIKQAIGGDYRDLAANFYMPHDDILLISQNPDPTDNVLQWVGRKPKNTIAKLRDVLQTMRREDCVAIIDQGRQWGKYCRYFMVKLL